MEKEKSEKPIETLRQREAFLVYFNLGEGRSLLQVRGELEKRGIKISNTSLGKWSGKFKWGERVQSMETEVADKAEQICIDKAVLKKSEILDAVRATLEKYSAALLADKLVPTASDFKKMWEIARVELNKGVGPEEVLRPVINIALINNEKVVKVVKEAQDKFKDLLAADIKEE